MTHAERERGWREWERLEKLVKKEKKKEGWCRSIIEVWAPCKAISSVKDGTCSSDGWVLVYTFTAAADLHESEKHWNSFAQLTVRTPLLESITALQDIHHWHTPTPTHTHTPPSPPQLHSWDVVTWQHHFKVNRCYKKVLYKETVGISVRYCSFSAWQSPSHAPESFAVSLEVSTLLDADRIVHHKGKTSV